ncbi:conserved hypothetical protein [Ricinus communis]|uniref:Uncharacterized protein n=1 Tax=Ricinus communis TaxID=3988 RepID=B9SCW3_RICCO|nr:conserved hypothetical protein [Ricinus communis]
MNLYNHYDLKGGIVVEENNYCNELPENSQISWQLVKDASHHQPAVEVLTTIFWMFPALLRPC